ncbi:MAG: endo-1,4-beta-xylanase [Clostridia bacterium]|nr:endo-1,4-beta-xylanase [Clostridia bacterium]
MASQTTKTVLEARERIEKVRKTNVELYVLENGKPVENAHVTMKMKKHDFLFGAVSYQYGKYPTQEQNDKFTKHFTHLFNYTMAPYHWNWYEKEKGIYNEPYTGNLVDWADRNGLKKKLHALIWHECCPDWIKDDDDVEKLYVERINHLMQHYGDRFDFFDVINETTVNDRFDNPVANWVKKVGPMHVMKFGTELVRTYRPDAKLLYGDWNIHGDEYVKMLTMMRENDIDVDILGLQAHQHRDIWTQEETLRVMDVASKFGWPIHFPETSFCSGKPIGEMNYGAGAINHFTETEADAIEQADLARDFYILVFSHPAVEALSWFDFTDHRWLNAPAGLVDDNLDPKPIYHELDKLINHDWHSDATGNTSSEGRFDSRLFFGTYEITVEIPGKETKVFTKELKRESFYEDDGTPRRISVNI